MKTPPIDPSSPFDPSSPSSLSKRQAFLKLPIEERRKILAQQAEELLEHYAKDSEWKALMAGDIISY
jgi:acyl-CoA reductase-like NAD-dependent aldehyde dehydrogenase